MAANGNHCRGVLSIRGRACRACIPSPESPSWSSSLSCVRPAPAPAVGILFRSRRSPGPEVRSGRCAELWPEVASQGSAKIGVVLVCAESDSCGPGPSGRQILAPNKTLRRKRRYPSKSVACGADGAQVPRRPRSELPAPCDLPRPCGLQWSCLERHGRVSRPVSVADRRRAPAPAAPTPAPTPTPTPTSTPRPRSWPRLIPAARNRRGQWQGREGRVEGWQGQERKAASGAPPPPSRAPTRERVVAVGECGMRRESSSAASCAHGRGSELSMDPDAGGGARR